MNHSNHLTAFFCLSLVFTTLAADTSSTRSFLLYKDNSCPSLAPPSDPHDKLAYWGFQDSAAYKSEIKLCSDKKAKYTGKQVAGGIIFGLGIACIVSGLVMLNSADWTDTETGMSTSDPVALPGILLTSAGAIGLIGGPVQLAIATVKKVKYKRRLEQISLFYSPRHAGFNAVVVFSY